MVTNQLKNMLIGLFVLIASSIIIGIILFIRPSVGDGKQTIKVRFENINGISVGTPVTYAGKPIGEVFAIFQVSDARQQGSNGIGQVYPYLLTLKIDSSYVIFTTDEITVQTQGLMGERYVAIIPRPLKNGEVAQIATAKDLLYASSNDLLESIMTDLSAVSSKLQDTLDKVNKWIDKYGDNLGSAFQSFDKTVTEIGKMVGDINTFGVIQDVKDTMLYLSQAIQQVDAILGDLREDNFFDHVAHIGASIDRITKMVATGRGTLGKIIAEDGLYLQIDALFTKANTILNDMNHYGLLFQYNKEWKRNRLKMMSEAARIQDPVAFQEYMNRQVDEINLILGRMAMLTDQCTSQELAASCDFREKFVQLMQQLNSFQDRVRLYNQELQEMSGR
jgi:phospholipid/cholesterol/gamma-HCH transport system substrate-binding protein